MSKISKEIFEKVSFNADKRKSNADIRRFSDETIRDHPRVICENLRSKRVFQNAALTKQQIRSRILKKLNSQKEDTRNRKSNVIKAKLFRIKAFKKAKVVMFYISFGGEVNTLDMIKEAHNLGKIIAVPVCKKNRVTLKPCILHNNARLKKGPYGVCEPRVKRFIRLKDLDLVIVPGLAFDKKGNRLGRGKGCYDSFLKRLTPDIPSIGLAFDFQILPKLPTTKTDVSVDQVIFA